MVVSITVRPGLMVYSVLTAEWDTYVNVDEAGILTGRRGKGRCLLSARRSDECVSPHSHSLCVMYPQGRGDLELLRNHKDESFSDTFDGLLKLLPPDRYYPIIA